MGEGQAEGAEGGWMCRSSSLTCPLFPGSGCRGDPFPPKSCYLFPSPPCPLAWQEPEQQAKVCRIFKIFFPPSQAAFSWQKPRAILRAAKFTEEHSETASSELGVYFQAASLQQGRAEGQSSGCSSFLVCELGYRSQNRREQTGLQAGSCFRGMWINPPP